MTWTADSAVAVFLPTRTVFFFPTNFVSLADWTDLFPALCCLQPTESELRAASLLIRTRTAGLEPDRVRGDCSPCVSTGCTSAVLPYVTCLSSLFSCAPCFSCKSFTLHPPSLLPLPSSTTPHTPPARLDHSGVRVLWGQGLFLTAVCSEVILLQSSFFFSCRINTHKCIKYTSDGWIGFVTVPSSGVRQHCSPFTEHSSVITVARMRSIAYHIGVFLFFFLLWPHVCSSNNAFGSFLLSPLRAASQAIALNNLPSLACKSE